MGTAAALSSVTIERRVRVRTSLRLEIDLFGSGIGRLRLFSDKKSAAPTGAGDGMSANRVYAKSEERGSPQPSRVVFAEVFGLRAGSNLGTTTTTLAPPAA